MLQAEVAWTEHVAEGGGIILPTKADPDSAPVMRAKREEVASNGYEGFLLQSGIQPVIPV